MLDDIFQYMDRTISIGGLNITLSVSGILEVLIFSVFIYYVIMWIKRTKAWNLLKGAVILLVVYMLSRLLGLMNISFLFEKLVSSLVLAVIIILQPEIRAALERLGRKTVISEILNTPKSGHNVAGLTDEAVNDVIQAVMSLGKNKVGALIVFERTILLNEYISTGIKIEALITAQLLEQIFEHNTPLHDGAVIIRGGRIMAATCYLPLSQNMEISKELGTRHRSGLGISEVSDSVTLIVSEETGMLSIAIDGMLKRNVSMDMIRKALTDPDEAQADISRKKYRKQRRTENEK